MTRAATVCPPEPGSDDDPVAARPVRPGRVRGARDFDALRRTRIRSRRGPVRVAFVPAPADGPVRIAYAIGRRVGNAVVRNRLRRQLRAVCAELDPAPGDYLVAAGPEAADLPFSELRSRVTTAFEGLR